MRKVAGSAATSGLILWRGKKTSSSLDVLNPILLRRDWERCGNI